MTEKNKQLFIGLIIMYAIAYLLTFALEYQQLMILLKPGASLLAWASMHYFTTMMKDNQVVKKLIAYAFMAWFIADVIAMVGELIIFSEAYNLVSFYNLEVVLYAISRVLILITIAALYSFVTKKTSQFQVMADLMTLIACMGITVWLVFFKPALQQQWALMIAGDLITIFSFFFISLSLFVHGLLLLNWLYFKERAITLGHKIALSGLAIVILTDLICAINPSLLYQGNSIDLAYKIGILMIALGGVYFNQKAVTQLKNKKIKKPNETWKNGFYFLAYPLLAWHIIGLDIDLMIYLLVIAFYMVSCLYTRQIDVTKAMLEKEIAYNKKLRNQHYFTSQLLDAMPGGIFYVSRDDQLLGMNSKLSQHYGVDTAAYLNCKLAEFPPLTDADLQEYARMKEEALITRKPCVRQSTFHGANGQARVALYSLNVYYLADGSVGGFLGVFTDITELKAKEKELEVALKNANAATEAKSQFLANMSHEIRTPMNAILGMSHLAMQTQLDARQADYLRKIHGAATALLGIINDILDFSKIESGKLEMETIDFDIEKVVNDAIQLFAESAAQKNLEFAVALSPALPQWFRGDPLRLGQVLTNLVGNAVKFTKSGKITVAIELGKSRNKQIQLKFTVADTGIGIVQKNLERLFEPFTQNDNSTTRHYGGTGLGLTISRNLVELMGGEIWAESQLGVGSTFSFTVWLEKSFKALTAAEPFYTPFDQQQRPLASLRILVAEDDPVNRQIAEEFLIQAGAQVDTVENGEVALQRMIEAVSRNHYDLILMDLQMPVMDGYEATRKIRIIDPNIPILAMTARTTVDEREECLINGMNDHISKPIDPRLLYHMIQQYVKPQRVNDPAVEAVKMTDQDKEKLTTMKRTELILSEAEKISEIDWEKLQTRLGKNPDIIITLLTVFGETHTDMASEMVRAYDNQNEDLLKRKLHTAKGVLGNIDATGLYQQVCKIESHLREVGLDEQVVQGLAAFKADFDNFYAAIITFINDQAVEPPEPQAKVDLASWHKKFVELLELVQEGDAEALGYFEENRQIFSRMLKPDQFTELADLLRGYAFDEALTLLTAIGKERGEDV